MLLKLPVLTKAGSVPAPANVAVKLDAPRNLYRQRINPRPELAPQPVHRAGWWPAIRSILTGRKP